MKNIHDGSTSHTIVSIVNISGRSFQSHSFSQAFHGTYFVTKSQFAHLSLEKYPQNKVGCTHFGKYGKRSVGEICICIRKETKQNTYYLLFEE
jgi:hypothetical protein